MPQSYKVASLFLMLNVNQLVYSGISRIHVDVSAEAYITCKKRTSDMRTLQYEACQKRCECSWRCLDRDAWINYSNDTLFAG